MRGMVVAPQPRAAEEGAKILERGGNAIDAAIATAFTQGIVDPQMCGVGGWGTMLLYLANHRDIIFLDFGARAGSKVISNMWEKDTYGAATMWGTYLIRGSPHILGYTSIMVPGMVKGLYEVWERYGTLKWEELVQPAIRHAREGFHLTPMVVDKWHKPENKEVGLPAGETALTVTEASRKIYLKEKGDFYQVGELLKNEDYALTLEKISWGGADVLYKGELAEVIAADMERNGGFITLEDLKSYQVKSCAPLLTTYRGYKIASVPPPYGGATVIEILNILEGYDLKKLGLNSVEYIYVMARAMQAAHADRKQWLADPDFHEVPVERMVSPRRAAEWQAKIDAGEKIKISHSEPDHEGTTHVNTIDEEGNVVALTHTNSSVSGVITPGLGFMYNNAMAWVNPFPDQPNSIAPGKTRTSGVAPTIVLNEGIPFFIVGAPGGTSIISAVSQSIINVIDHGMKAQEAVWAPRIHCEGDNVIVSARVSSAVCEELRGKGLNVTHSVNSWGAIPFALAHGVIVDSLTGQFDGGADPGGEGGVVGVNCF